jgi:HPt (histidine-containing phosphotransfer) domain-containing protein
MSQGEAGPLDGTILEGLRLCGGAKILSSTIASVLEHIPQRISALGEAVRRGDLTEAARTAHSLRGSAGTVGALGIVRACALLEEAATAGRAGALAEALAAVESQWPRVAAALEAERGQQE